MTADQVLESLKNLEFENFVDIVNNSLNEFRAQNRKKKADKPEQSKKETENTEESSEDMAAEDSEL